MRWIVLWELCAWPNDPRVRICPFYFMGLSITYPGLSLFVSLHAETGLAHMPIYGALDSGVPMSHDDLNCNVACFLCLFSTMPHVEFKN